MNGANREWTRVRRRLAILMIGILLAAAVCSGTAFGENGVRISMTSSQAMPVYGSEFVLSSTVTDATPGGSTPAGTVTFTENGTLLGTAALQASMPVVETAAEEPPSIPAGDKVTCIADPNSLTPASCPVLKWGDHTYWAFSLSDNSDDFDIVAFDSSGAIVKQQKVSGARYLYRITVDQAAQTVTFRGQGDYSVTLAWSQLEGWNARASLSLASLPVGSHTIQAQYSGDANHTGGVTAMEVTVRPVPTFISLSSAEPLSVYGEKVVLTAAVTGGLAATGTVTLLDGDRPLGTGELQADGTAVFSLSGLGAGMHSITAVYSGDDRNAGSVSVAVNQMVAQRPTSLAVSTNAPASRYGDTVTWTAAVIGGSEPGGTVTFSDGAQDLGTVTVQTYGEASFSMAALPVGDHSIQAFYSGDANHTGSSADLIQVVDKAGTLTKANANVTQAVYGTAVTLSAAVAGGGGGSVPTGRIEFADGSAVFASVPMQADGTASWTVSGLLPGIHPITAAYSGDASYDGSKSGAYSVVINKIPTATTVGASVYQATYGGDITYTARVASQSAYIPTGTVMFQADGDKLASASLQPDGTATVTVPLLAVGSHQVAAVYLGDTIFAESASNGVPVIIDPSSQAGLSELSVQGAALSPAFRPDQTRYLALARQEADKVALTAVTSDPNAAVTVNGQPLTGMNPVPLQTGLNPFTVTVTAQDGYTSKSYVVFIIRAASSRLDIGQVVSMMQAEPDLNQNGVFDSQDVQVLLELIEPLSVIKP
ncbi:Ig-like domain repeat protein [Paenibacillus doosanensis]|uniref:Ig-like domain repeat protein n=1 Tax=Paenibacillus doosanensis TaxID=1229154 RepID=UPI0021801E54|nr:Ig-like domain repeat protein [Paenibacillus doosanensis]MCS7460285.1 Ig-like domain repeat protein [Paenibacillus doosanensis]